MICWTKLGHPHVQRWWGTHSGGGVALQFAYQFPDYAARLGLVASGGLGREVSWALRAAALPGAEFVLPVIAHAADRRRRRDCRRTAAMGTRASIAIGARGSRAGTRRWRTYLPEPRSYTRCEASSSQAGSASARLTGCISAPAVRR